MFSGLHQDPATYGEYDPFRSLRSERTEWFQAVSSRLLKGGDPHGAKTLQEMTARAVQRRQYHPEAIRLLLLTLLKEFVFGAFQRHQFSRTSLNNWERFYAKKHRRTERDLRYWQSAPYMEGEPIRLVREEEHRKAIGEALDQYRSYSKRMLQWCHREMRQEPTGRDHMALFRLHVAVTVLTGQPNYAKLAALLNAAPPRRKSSRPEHWKADTLRKIIERMRDKDPGLFEAVELALGVAYYL